jgi:hypothetical protein
MPDESNSGSETIKILIAWIVVLIPAAWGVAQVVSKSADLFK